MNYLIALPMLFMSLQLSNTTPATQTPPFSSKLFYAIAKDKSSENIIFSPMSISTCLALTYLGAGGSTADELKNILQLSGDNKEIIAEKFNKVLTKTQNDEAKLKITNRIYVDKKFQIAPKFNEIALKHFKAKAENVEFEKSEQTAKEINSWVEEQTENKIKNLISPSSLDSDTASVLVNAIYFKANWSNPFESYATQKQHFTISETNKVEVDMMGQEEKFLYGELADLDATAVEMSYVGTGLTMLIVLPKSVGGLAALEEKLKDIDLKEISKSLAWEKVNLKLPKFKLEFDISLKPVLQKLGIKTMFTRDADFNELLRTKQNLFVSEVKHKAFIEVNEMGTEAAAATFVKISLESLVINERVYDFVADHPFYFAIKDKENVYFAGHVAKF